MKQITAGISVQDLQKLSKLRKLLNSKTIQGIAEGDVLIIVPGPKSEKGLYMVEIDGYVESEAVTLGECLNNLIESIEGMEDLNE